MPCQCNKFTFEEKPDVFQMFQGGGGAVKSVNGKTGVVVLTAEDVGALPDTYEAPVTSVNEKTGAVVLDAGDIGYDGETTYPDATVGKELGTINSALTSLESVTEIIDTASGAIASFPDGSGLPMRSLVAEINPVQDLHGQSSPYPAGGGKNLLPYPYRETTKTVNGITITDVGDGSLIINGTTTGKVWFEFKNKTNSPVILPSGTYSFKGSGNSNISYSIEMTSSGTVTNVTEEGRSITYNEQVSFGYFATINSGASFSNYKIYPQIEIGSTITDFAPYANICPISGHTGLSVEVTGKNLLGLDGFNQYSSNYILEISGNEFKITHTNQYQSTYPIFSLAKYVGKQLTFKLSEMSTNFGIVLINAGESTQIGNQAVTFTVSDSDSAIRFRAFNLSAGTTATITDMQLEFGSTPTAYEEPKAPTTTTVSWQDTAGTVYGGQDEIVGGELTNTMGKKNISLTNFAYNPTINCLLGYSSYGFFSDAKAPANNNTPFNAIADSIKINSAGAINGGADGLGITTTKDVYLRCGGFSSKQEYLDAFPNGIDVVYELDTPQSFTHAPTQISTLFGQNNVWHDANGDTTVTYQASIKGYIDKVLGS